MSIGLFILAIYIVAIMQMHYRGHVRFHIFRQMITHTNYLAPYNLLMNLFSKLPNKPILNTESIAELSILKDNWEVIRDEAMNLSKEGQIKSADGLNDAGFNSFFRQGWTRYYLKWYGNPLPSALKACPKTIEILKQTPSVKAAMFASLPSGGVLNPHRDPFAGSLRYHLGIATPNDDDCYILVDGQKLSWRDGEGVLFDETYIHEAHNKTDQNRIILFCDVTRPMKFKIIMNLTETASYIVLCPLIPWVLKNILSAVYLNYLTEVKKGSKLRNTCSLLHRMSNYHYCIILTKFID